MTGLRRFIARPVATSLLAGALVVVGVVCYLLLPVSALPQVDFPTVNVSASMAGASPETMASNVAMPLERQFALIPGVVQITSSNALSSTQVVVQFAMSRNIDAAVQDVQAAINAASGQLPTNLNSAPTVHKSNPADQPIIAFVMRSDTLPVSAVTDYFDTVVVGQLSQIEGVGQVNYGGTQKPAIRLQIDPRRAAALGLQLDAIRAAIATNTVNAPKGQFAGPQQNLIVYSNDQVLQAAAWNDFIIAYRNGAPIRLRDVGQAVADVENTQTGAYAASGLGDRSSDKMRSGAAIVIFVNKQPGANIVKTATAVRRSLDQIASNLPGAIELRVVQDRTQTIRAAVWDVQLTILITIVAVSLVVFAFLRDGRATAIASLVIPMSLIGSAAFMLPLGYSLDNLSLMAMTIAVGFVVDDAIVMVEAVWRRIESGERPMVAAANGVGEIAFTVFSISLSLVAVFTPLMFMGGVIGRMMREFAFTLSLAVVISLVLSVTFTPMLCARLLRRSEPGRKRPGGERFMGWVDKAYAAALERVMRRPGLTLALFVGASVAAMGLYGTASTGFFPQQDTGFLSGALVAAQDSSFAKTSQKAREAVDVIAQDPDVVEAHFIMGGNASQAGISISLVPKEEGRVSTPAQIMDRLRPQLDAIVGAQVFLQPMQDIQVGGRTSRAQYQYTLADGDLDELNLWAPRLLESMQKLPQLRDVNSDQQSAAPSATVTIDRDAAARFGITASDVDAAIYNQIGQRQVAQNFTQQNYYRIVLEAPPAMQVSPALLDATYLRSPTTGGLVPLSLVAHVETGRPRNLSIGHQGQSPAVTLSFNLAPGVSLSQAVAAVQRARLALGAPVTLTGSFQGVAAAFQESLSSMPLLIAASLLSVYVVLGVLYESYIHPLTILSTLPSAGLGALLALRLAGQDLNVIGIIALILLIGIVKKNGIMIVDVALELERDAGRPPVDAIMIASRQRLRPILMTTACAMLGGVPMILGHGTGSEFRQPLGWAIVGGLLVSQILTLFSTPVIYVYLDQLRLWLSRRGPAGRKSDAETAAPSGAGWAARASTSATISENVPPS